MDPPVEMGFLGGAWKCPLGEEHQSSSCFLSTQAGGSRSCFCRASRHITHLPVPPGSTLCTVHPEQGWQSPPWCRRTWSTGACATVSVGRGSLEGVSPVPRDGWVEASFADTVAHHLGEASPGEGVSAGEVAPLVLGLFVEPCLAAVQLACREPWHREEPLPLLGALSCSCSVVRPGRVP